MTFATPSAEKGNVWIKIHNQVGSLIQWLNKVGDQVFFQIHFIALAF
jgi:hypothetical protein